MKLEPDHLARLAAKQSLEILLSPLPQYWDYRCVLLHLAFYEDVRGQTAVSVACVTSTILTDPMLSPFFI